MEEIRVGEMVYKNPISINKNGIKQIWPEWEDWKEEDHILQEAQIYNENEITLTGCYVIELVTGEKILIQSGDPTDVILIDSR